MFSAFFLYTKCRQQQFVLHVLYFFFLPVRSVFYLDFYFWQIDIYFGRKDDCQWLIDSDCLDTFEALDLTYRSVARCRCCWLVTVLVSFLMFGLLRFWMLRICSSVRLKRLRMVRLKGFTTTDCTPSGKKEGSKGEAFEWPDIEARTTTRTKIHLLKHFSQHSALAILLFLFLFSF